MVSNSYRIIALACALLAGAGVLASVYAQEKLEGELVIRTSGGVYEQKLKEFFLDPFTKATGVKVITVPTTYGEQMVKMKAMKEAGHVEWDILNPKFDELPLLGDYLVDLGDCSSLPNVAAQGIPETCAKTGILAVVSARHIAWDPKAFPKGGPQNWADFWNLKAFPGNRSLPSDGAVWDVLSAALMADGVAPDKLFPLDVDRAFKKMDEIRPSVVVWWKTGDQSMALMRSGEAVLSEMFSSRAQAMKVDGASIDWTFNQGVADTGAFAILKGAPHPKASAAFLNFFMANPEAHAGFIRELGLGTPNRFSRDYLSADLRDTTLANPEFFKKLVRSDAKWLAENQSAIVDRWNKWLAQ